MASSPTHVKAEARPNRKWVLSLLLVTYGLCTADRAVIGILQEAIKAEFKLADFQLGLLGGPAFALLYSLVGLPIGRVADTRNRIYLLAGCLLAWSVMTALCGLATSFTFLLFARMAVSVGEAGCNPSANSLIADIFPPSRRASALSVYVLGVPLGGLAVAWFGGWLANSYGWRAAFVGLGLPGIVLAFLILATVKEPSRSSRVPARGFGEVFSVLAQKKTFWHGAVAAALVGFVGYGVNQYLVSFLVRTHGLSLFQGAGIVGVVIGICGGLGALSSGFLADRISHRFPRALPLIPAVGLTIATPCYLLAFVLPSLWTAMPILMLGAALHGLYMAPIYAIPQGVAPSNMRATAVALMLLILNLVGYGLGPPIVGFLSDQLAQANMAAVGISKAQCSGMSALGECHAAVGDGLRHAMMIVSCVQLWAALHFFLASRTMVGDWEE